MEYKNNISKFKIGNIVRYKKPLMNQHFGEMRIVDISVECKFKFSKQRKKYLYNEFLLLPINEKCKGIDDIDIFDKFCRVLERDIEFLR